MYTCIPGLFMLVTYCNWPLYFWRSERFGLHQLRTLESVLLLLPDFSIFCGAPPFLFLVLSLLPSLARANPRQIAVLWSDLTNHQAILIYFLYSYHTLWRVYQYILFMSHVACDFTWSSRSVSNMNDILCLLKIMFHRFVYIYLLANRCRKLKHMICIKCALQFSFCGWHFSKWYLWKHDVYTV